MYVQLSEGIRKFDSCIGGLGGCPFAPGAAGKSSHRRSCKYAHQMGYETNVDLEKLSEIVNYCLKSSFKSLWEEECLLGLQKK